MQIEIAQAVVGAVSDASLMGLILHSAYAYSKPNRSPNRGSTILLLSIFSVASVLLLGVFTEIHSAGAIFAGVFGRLGLACALAYGAFALSKAFKTTKETVRQEMTLKLEEEFVNRRKIEQELAHLASFAEQDQSSIVELSPTGDVRYMNPAAERAFADLKAKGKNHPILEGLDGALTLMRGEHKTMLTRTIQYGDNVYRQQICFSDPGPSVRLHMSDVTELVQLERLQAHLLKRLPIELQEPLITAEQNLQRTLHQLRPQLVWAQEEEFLTTLKLLGDLNRVLQELIDGSQRRSGKVVIHRQRADFRALVRRAADALAPAAQARGLTIAVGGETAPLEVLFDWDRMLTAMMQAAQTLIDASAPGALQFTASLRGAEVCCVLAGVAPAEAPVDLPLAAARAILEAHGGRIDRPASGALQCTLAFPVLSADDFFYERLRQLHEAAMAAGTSLSIVRLQVPGWAELAQSLGAERAAALTTQLQIIVSKTLRSRSDFAIQSRQSLWLTLPEARAKDVDSIMERLQQNFREYVTQNELPPSVSLQTRSVTYPDTGKTVETLLLLLGWFTDDIGGRSVALKQPRQAA